MKKIPMLEKFAAQSLVESDGELVFSKEKFAELIVRECMACSTWVGKVNNNAIEPVHTAHAINQCIKKQFGVEEQEKVAPKPKCSVCGTTENVRYMGGYQPYLCDSVDCIPF
jgi:hypothetical protein